MKTLKDQVADLEISNPRDYDPEELDGSVQGKDDDSDSEERNSEFDGREHYEEVEKSKLRKPTQPVLGKQYSGAAVSRATLNRDNSDDDLFAPVEEDDDLDPFAAQKDQGNEVGESSDDMSSETGGLRGDVAIEEDEEIDSDEAFCESDTDKFKDFKFLGSSSNHQQKNHINGSQSVEEEDSKEDEQSSVTDQEDFSETDDDDLSMNGDESDADSNTEEPMADELARATPEPSADREKLKNLLSNDAATVASALSAAVSADAQKGSAVKQQFQTFDRLLDARIKLQKGLVAANELSSPSAFVSDEEAQAAVRKAEEAALSLWSTIESVRQSILKAQEDSKDSASNLIRKKRKASIPPTAATPNTSSSELWIRTEALETTALPTRRAVLNKWAAKTRATSSTILAPNSTASRSKLFAPYSSSLENQLTTILDAQLSAELSKLSNPSSSDHLYNDTPFYQSLLRDLIAARSSISIFTGTSSLSQLPSNAALSKTKTKKQVDTKASKGRKVRYTVHEKLANFAAPEGNSRATWGEAAARELFAGLLGGGRPVLDEGEENGFGTVQEEEEDREVEALRLFRS